MFNFIIKLIKDLIVLFVILFIWIGIFGGVLFIVKNCKTPKEITNILENNELK